MSLGSDSPGGSPEGIGGDESGIGGGGPSSGYEGGGFSGFASEYGPTGLGGFDFGGFGDPGTSRGFGDVGLGADLDSAFDFGGGLEKIGYSSYGGSPAMTTDISQELAAMPPAEQERLFRLKVEPALAKHYGVEGEAAKFVASKIFGAIASGFVPGLGTLASITGATGYLADKMQDMSFAQDLGEQLGIRDINDLDKVSAENLLSGANAVLKRRGEDMGLWEDITGKSAAGAATGAAGTQAGYQQQALDYLKQMGAIPLEAQQQLAGVYGLPGGVGTQQQMIEQAQASPLYGAIMGGQQAGEEAIMRQAGATGGLRSGNIQEALADYNTQLQNQALMQSYGQQMGGLTGLAGMGTYAPQVASGMAGIGGTLAAGQTAAAQAEQAGMANLLGLGGAAYKAVGGLGGLYEAGKDIGTAYSTAGGGMAGLGAAGSSILDTVAGWF